MLFVIWDKYILMFAKSVFYYHKMALKLLINNISIIT